MNKKYVNIAHYDDRGDPSPPNNYRPELVVGNYTFLLEGCRDAYNGCMPVKEASKIAYKIGSLLKLEVKDSWSVDTEVVGKIEIYYIYKNGDKIAYAIERKPYSKEQWDLYIGENKECQECGSLDECFEVLQTKAK